MFALRTIIYLFFMKYIDIQWSLVITKDKLKGLSENVRDNETSLHWGSF